MVCPHCQAKNLVNSKFCESCGRPLSDDIPSYLYPEDKDIWETVKQFGKDFQQKISEKNYKEVLADRSNPVTNMLITFIAWLLLRMIGIIPFIIIVKILAILMTPIGLIFSLGVTYVYSIHHDEIMRKYQELKEMDHLSVVREIIKSYNEAKDEVKEEDENT